MSYLCPWDGCDDEFDTDRGRSIHHYRSHEESIAGIDKVCEECGDDFIVGKGNENQKYCSEECFGLASRTEKEISCDYCGESFLRHECHIEENNFCSRDCYEKSQRDRVVSECDNCGEEYEVSRSRQEKFGRRFCSADCFYKSNSGENHYLYGRRVTLECDWCSGEYEVDKYREEASRFCSHKCRGHWMSENWVGENAPAWKGGRREYPSPWYTQRREALQRDDYQCQFCGISDEEHQEEFGWSLEVHHIVSYREFDSDEEAHELSNLVTLCRDCHSSIESLSESEQRQKLAV